MISRLGADKGDVLNAFANDPSIRPSIGGIVEGPLDWSPLLADRNMYALYGQYGGVLYSPLMPGLYEGHIQVLPHARGKWALRMLQETFLYMFARTDAMELVARIPEYNRAARGILRLVGAHRERDQEDGWVISGTKVPVTWYSFTIHDWIRKDPLVRPISLCMGGHEGKKAVFGERLTLMSAHF